MQVADKDRPKTEFSTHRGQLQWEVMPFGLSNGPASFTRLMNLALDGLTWTYCLLYRDDIIVWSDTFDEHLSRLGQVFDRIRKAGLKLKPAKCQFLKKRVTFLGHVVSCNGIETDPEKTRAVDDWPTPENLTELQSFLGLASYYRRFIFDFSIVAEPLYRLSKKGVKFQWEPEQRKAFEELKHRLTSAPVLAYPDFSPGAGLFVLDTDASQRLGIGAVLSQVQADGTERVVAYGSRSLNDHERNYCTTRLEMLALVTYVDYFRYYLAGCKVLVRTDHHSLKWLMSFREPESQVARWLERRQEYNFEVEHRAGKSHCNADPMSRKPRRSHGDCPSCGPTGPTRTRVSTLTPWQPKAGGCVTPRNLWSADAITQAQREDPDIGLVLDQYLKEKEEATRA